MIGFGVILLFFGYFGVAFFCEGVRISFTAIRYPLFFGSVCAADVVPEVCYECLPFFY